jgi:hypothetical protein
VNTFVTNSVRIERLWHAVRVHTSFGQCCIHFCIVRIRLYNGMCVVFCPAHRLGMRCLLQPQPFSLKYCIIRLSCFLSVIGSLLPLKHGSQKRFIPHLLTFHTPTLRLVSYLALHRLISDLTWLVYICAGSILAFRFILGKGEEGLPQHTTQVTPMQISAG